ncbi:MULTISPECIES: cell division protein ZipA [Aeromonas]|jgi:cell division protein ZipA|uniref:Cell division protein ZipA n=2 Tax=Aeromonas TaxID=642 RepID=A0ABT7PVB5_9GAMM|nr:MULTISPECIES: cell division protein ZipA [Aeromonas]MCW0504674.1 cell division protein ZipA [Aeromonas piscicola]MCX7132760.1 cell division protein ZipA [Aeromonas sp.]MDM5071042.1 cell division protein ZipA [Aeromonas bestiarum]MDM5087648.1 cell division protein ZipA [Aeromonas bestiarum]MDM5130391.1 cell division protein ZipA [Aeromonas piscicola]
MQELRYILVALGGIAIAALLIHGLWSNRKNRQAPIKEKPLGRMESKSRTRDNDAFDSDGIGQVRVVSGSRRAEPKLHSDEARQPDVSRRAPVPAFDDEDDDAELPPPVVRKPAARPVAPPPVYEEDEEEFEEPLAETAEEAPAAPVRKPAQVIRRTPVHRSRPQREPLLQPLDDEPLVEPAYATAPTFGVREPVQAPAPEYKQARYAVPEPAYEEPVYEEPVREPLLDTPPVEKIWQDVYVINLMARPGHDLQGATLLASLMALGFKFGEMDIFHRHEDLNGKGEVLFSMINMVKPGTFNPYRMEQFDTPGVSLFMQLPLRSNAAFAFEHMLQAADQLASDLDAMLTDMDRSPLSDETIARYRHELAAYEASRD